ncbi:MAG TPA: hypothetical protein VK090_08940 [Paracoccaceae bacterium]|nr:hypothetical protein [Paracoccaceae bacterium]
MDPALLAEFCEEYTRHLNRLRGEKNATLAAAKAELGKLEGPREPDSGDQRRRASFGSEGRPRPRITAHREELEALLADTKEEPVLLHPNMAGYYREQVAALAEALTAEENRAEAADLLRSLIERIELSPNAESKLDIDLYGDLAGILALAANENGPLGKSDPSQDKVVAGMRNRLSYRA